MSGVRASKARGFTLIELLIVIAIIATLAALILGAIGAVRTRTKINLTQGRIRLIQLALEAYEKDFGDYPPSDGDDGVKGAANLYQLLMTEKKNGPYVKLSGFPVIDNNGDTVIADEWKKPIYYIHHREYHNQPPKKHEYRLISGGPDGISQGGEKDSDDIVNWAKERPNEE